MEKITPRELRCGNLVEYKGQHVPVLKIDSMNELIDDGKLIYKGHVTVPQYSPDGNIWNYHSPWIAQVNPIPLTEEWLIRCGLKKYKTDDLIYYTKDKITICDWGKGFIFSNAFSFDVRPELKTLHQLQNLWFAIFNEELTISEPTKQ